MELYAIELEYQFSFSGSTHNFHAICDQVALENLKSMLAEDLAKFGSHKKWDFESRMKDGCFREELPCLWRSKTTKVCSKGFERIDWSWSLTRVVGLIDCTVAFEL